VRISAAFLLAFAIAVPQAGAAPARLRSAQLDEAIYAQVKKGFSGGVLISRGKTAVLDRGYGDGIGPDALFWIASVAKQFVAAAILAGVEQGQLALGDPVSRFFPDAPADKRDVTVQELLAHTSGFAPGDSADGAKDREAAVRAIFAHASAGPRGQFRYSNDNYQLAAAIVEVVNEMPYRDVAKELWKRADIFGIGFAGDPGTRRVAAAAGNTPERLSRASWGAQGVFSTTRALWGWQQALASSRVLSRESVARMFQGVAPIQEGEAALGWFVGREADGETYYFTRGNEDWGPNALVYIYPKSETVVVILSHAGDAPSGLSWSRELLKQLSPMLR
jgi:CubicO group peptidase (beta-lactamase class C family)